MIVRIPIREIFRERWHMGLDVNRVEWIGRSMLCQLASLPVVLTEKMPSGPSAEASGHRPGDG